MITRPVAKLGHAGVQTVQQLGGMGSFATAIVAAVFAPPCVGALFRQLYKLGVVSLIIICLSGFAVGMVLALQGYHMLVRFGPSSRWALWWG